MTDNIKVNIAADEKGHLKAKCPQNKLKFDWQWPEGEKNPWEKKGSKDKGDLNW